MHTRMLFSLIVLSVVALNWAAFSESTKRSRTVVLERADLKLTPAALAFNAKGELYVAYRDKGEKKKSSSLWVRVFDPASGKQLRATNIRIPETSLPIGGYEPFVYTQLLLAPDSSVLVYAEFYSGHAFVVVLDATTLQKISETTTLPDGADRQFPKVISIDSNDRSVLIAAEKTNRLNGTDVRLIRLDANELSRVLSDVTLTNPIPESGFVIGPNGEARIVRANMLYGYDPSTAKATLELSIENQDDIRNALFLEDGSLMLWSNQNDFGYLYRWEKDGSAPLMSPRFEGCGLEEIYLSPDQAYAVAFCEHVVVSELFFGLITLREFTIFETKTLKPLFRLPFKYPIFFFLMNRYVHHEPALWHEDGKILLALLTSSNKLRIYEFAAPRSGAASTSADSIDGSPRRSVPGRGAH